MLTALRGPKLKPHSAGGAMTGNGDGLLLYFDFKRTRFLNVFSKSRVEELKLPVRSQPASDHTTNKHLDSEHLLLLHLAWSLTFSKQLHVAR